MMDWLKTELGTFMALQLACGAISDTRLTFDHDDFWKQLRVVSVLLEYHLDKSTRLLKSYDDGKHITKLAEECLRSAWTYVTELHRLPREEKALPIAAGRNLLDTRFLLQLWYVLLIQMHIGREANINPRLVRDQPCGIQIPEQPTKLDDLNTIDGLISTTISAFSKVVKHPDLFPIDIMDQYRNSTRHDISTMTLRRRNIEIPSLFGREEVFCGISEPCPGTCDRTVDTHKKNACSVLRSDEMLITWLRNRDYSNNICWICGDPGSGKSVFLKHIVSLARSEPSMFKPDARGAASNRGRDREKPMIIWHIFARSGDPVSMQREELTMIQNILLQLFRQFPGEIDRAFAKTYNMMLSQQKPDYIKAGLSTFRFKTLENTLFYFLADMRPVRPRIFIFLDGPSGFSRQKTAFLNVSEAEDCPLVYKLRGVKGVKVCVASRPGGMFHDWDRSLHGREERGYMFHTLRIQDYTRGDIQTFCANRLMSVLLPLRLPLAASIADASQGSFILARDGCEAGLRDYEQSENQQAITYSTILFNSLLDELHAMPSYYKLPNYLFGPENRLDTLSAYLNLIITHTKYNMSLARAKRPLSLLQLTLAVDSYRGTLPSAPLTDYQMEFLARACDTIAHKIKKELYPLVVLRELENEEKLTRGVGDNLGTWPGGVANVRKGLVFAAGTKVMLLHSNMLEYLETTNKGRALLERNDCGSAKALIRHDWSLKGRDVQVVDVMKTNKDRFVRDRVAMLLRASMFEHALLMPGVVNEECEEWLGRGGTQMIEAERNPEPEPKRRYHATRSKTASATTTSAKAVKTESYRPYHEHLKLLENLPEVRGLEGEMLLFEVWPKTFVKQIKIEPEEVGSDEGSEDGGSRREGKRRRME